MRGSIAALAALTLGGAVACSVQASTAPTAAMLTSSATVGPSVRRDPLDISGSWGISDLVISGYLPGTEIGFFCEPYAIFEQEEWNSLLLTQDGKRIVGTSRAGMDFDCWTYGSDQNVSWYIDIDDTFEGRVERDQVSLSLNEHVEVRVRPDPSSDGRWIGTLRVRMDPRPIAKPFWVEQPIDLWTTTSRFCYQVHLEPPYCIPNPPIP
jgi:hypothetical protein